MKKIILFFAAALLSNALIAQQEVLFSQYTFNPSLYNPAAVGSTKNHEIRAFHRWQWVDFPGAPMTFGLSYQGGKGNNGFGAYLYTDRTGPTRRIGAQASYAYHLRIAEDAKLSLGLAGRFMRYEINTNIINFNDQTDLLANAGRLSSNKGEAAAGVYFHTPKFYAGISSLNLLQTKLDLKTIPNTDAEARYSRHYYLGAGANLGGETLGFHPNLLLKMTQNTPLQYEIGTRVTFKKHDFGIGAAYRGSMSKGSPGFISFNFNTILDKRLPIVIGVDIATGQFQQRAGFAYEVMAGADFIRKDMTNYIEVK